MKKMDFLRELRSLNKTELDQKIRELKVQMLEHRIKMKEGLLKNPLVLRVMRRNVAIINTVKNEKGA